jgi:hypothetical protein
LKARRGWTSGSGGRAASRYTARYSYQLVFANQEVGAFFRERYPDINVVVVSFDPCE